jgi:hypothetical protein
MCNRAVKYETEWAHWVKTWIKSRLRQFNHLCQGLQLCLNFDIEVWIMVQNDSSSIMMESKTLSARVCMHCLNFWRSSFRQIWQCVFVSGGVHMLYSMFMALLTSGWFWQHFLLLLICASSKFSLEKFRLVFRKSGLKVKTQQCSKCRNIFTQAQESIAGWHFLNSLERLLSCSFNC